MRRPILAGMLAVWFAVVASALPVKAATSERFVHDPNSGVALYGFDPVAYFIDRSARPGAAEYEFRFAGIVWRFRSEANRAAFAQAPEDFLPVFGGYDPIAVSEGVPLEGNPAFFAVSDGKLFLFARDESLAKFLANPKNLFDAAVNAWPQVQKKLVP
jgi:YHS domain-containing protein